MRALRSSHPGTDLPVVSQLEVDALRADWPGSSTTTAAKAAPATAEDQRKTSLATRTSVESASLGAISP
jgi:hypothetical protein